MLPLRLLLRHGASTLPVILVSDPDAPIEIGQIVLPPSMPTDWAYPRRQVAAGELYLAHTVTSIPLKIRPHPNLASLPNEPLLWAGAVEQLRAFSNLLSH